MGSDLDHGRQSSAKGSRSFRTREWGLNVEIGQRDGVSKPAFIEGCGPVNKEHTALKQRWSSLPAALRALLVRRSDGERNSAETTDASRAPIRKEPPRRVDVDAEGRQVAVYPASIGQQRLWFLDQLDSTAGAAYNLATGLQLQGSLDRAALRATLDTIVARHEALRTSFVVLDGQPVQRIAPAGVGFHMIEHDLTGLSGTAQTAADR